MWPRGPNKCGLGVNFSLGLNTRSRVEFTAEGEMAGAVNLELDANVQTFETQFRHFFSISSKSHPRFTI